jgi:hypothetical protein
MYKETRISKLGNLLGQKFDTCHGIAKYYSLVDLQLGEKCVQAMHLLAFLDESIELRDALECQLIHEIDFICIGHVLNLEIQDRRWKGGRVHQNLTVSWQEIDEVFDDGLELWTKQLICFIHYHANT